MANLYGTGPNQVPLNSMLGNLAFQDKAYVSVDKVGIGTTFTDSGTAGQILQVYGGGAYVSGSVGIGTTNPTQPLDVNGNLRIRSGLYDFNNSVGAAGSILVSTGIGVSWTSSVSSSTLLATDDTTTTSLYPVMVGSVGVVTTVKVSSSKISFNASTGELTAVNYNSSSDMNLKENISRLSESISILKQLEPVKFNWKDTGRLSYGLIAQDIEKILPELVREENNTKSVSYIPLIALLINAVVDLYNKVEEK